MSDLTRARARADAFAHAVDHGPRHSSRLSDDPELLEAVELAGRLRTAGAVAPRPEFSAELRHRLLEQAAARAATTPTVVRSTPDSEEDLPPREDDEASVTPIRHRPGRRIRLVASTAALVLLGGGIGSAAAAQQAMPGDTLYGMKRSIENVSTNVSPGDDSRGRRDLQHAMTRLSEVRALVSNGGDVAAVDGTLDVFSQQARKGVSRLVASYQQDGDASSITAITTFITSARQAIGELAPQLPPESLKSAVEALATIEQLAQHTTAACPKCDQPKPAKNAGQPSTDTTRPSAEPKDDPTKAVPPSTTTAPSAKPSVKPSTAPTDVPDTTKVEERNTTQPTKLATPPVRPSTRTPTVTPSGSPLPSLPTPGTPSWPWPFPTLSLPTLNLPGVVQTLLPPWN
ncbi:hypothetical protein Kfla_6382 [Kribbella flavida DSM 17836]|uniref:DUF5667 domain-containing protein n=1 Tax=Kribbella flavida (strain DSM 17836 / JCM 10339 / NBRC 14399) TaxID=479435 RepID=D2PX00_KRIFD|nr:hypothetical protein Kfla_6382 [Kribbella flavida DSM 17836]